MKFHEICANEHAKRAAEVGLAGDHKIAFIGPPDGDAWALALAVNRAYLEMVDGPDARLAWTWQRCPCGNAGDGLRECTCSAATISRWFFEHPFPQADIYVEVVCPDADRLIRWAQRGFTDGELHGQVLHRVECARIDGMSGPHEFTDTAWSLLRNATHQLILQTSHLRSTVEVAKTIARLARADRVEAAHMAEAIQYRPRN
jgi:magnesium chelatase family protein